MSKTVPDKVIIDQTPMLSPPIIVIWSARCFVIEEDEEMKMRVHFKAIDRLILRTCNSGLCECLTILTLVEET